MSIYCEPSPSIYSTSASYGNTGVGALYVGYPSVTFAVAATVSISIVFIVMFAKLVGSLLPLGAEKIGLDPAVMANPLISTLTDAVSLLIYIYIAKLILHI